MKRLKKYRYISCGIAKSTDKISDFRLIGGSQLLPEERVVLRVIFETFKIFVRQLFNNGRFPNVRRVGMRCYG